MVSNLCTEAQNGKKMKEERKKKKARKKETMKLFRLGRFEKKMNSELYDMNVKIDCKAEEF